MLGLNGYGRNVFLSCRGLFFSPRSRVDPTIAAVVADPVDGRVVVDDGGVVNVVDHGGVHVVHRTVVKEAIAVPTPAFVAVTEVAEAIHHAAVEADTRRPVALMEYIAVVGPGPVAWRQSRPGSGAITQVPGTQK